MVKVKICGLKREEDIKAANALMPDYAGFVFAGTKRNIGEEQAERLRRILNPSIPAVGVFVNEPAGTIVRLVKKKIIQLIQLHGEEGEQEILALRKQLELEGIGETAIIKAVQVRKKETITAAQSLPCDMLLLDAFDPLGQHGGTGNTFDLSLIPPLTKPFFLAGGLNPENVRAAVERVKPFGVDVSSGVETNGWKDKEKMKAFLEVRK